MDVATHKAYHAPLPDIALDQIFREARSHNKFADRPVSDEMLRAVVDLMKMGPTSANQSPVRIVFIKSPQAKALLKPALSAGNLDKTMAAPVTALFGYDTEFYDKLPFLFPHDNARSWFAGKPEAVLDRIALLNSTLQVAYFIIAARALGIDTGPMSGFDPAKTDAAFFPDRKVRSTVLINLGYGDPAGLYSRSPRFAFEGIARFA